MGTLGERIKTCRQSKGMTQEELAALIGVSKSAVNKYELNKRIPNLLTLEHLTDALGVTPSYLLDEVIQLGSDVLHKAEDGSVITVSSDTREGKLLICFQGLNTLGQDELIRQAENLLEADKFRRNPINVK